MSTISARARDQQHIGGTGKGSSQQIRAVGEPGSLRVDEDTVFQEILYGQNQSKRSDQCFVFILEDKTVSQADDQVNDVMRSYLGLCNMLNCTVL